MRKLLLFALTMGLSTMTFAQFNTEVSVDSYDSPTGNITLQDPANGTTTISVVLTNNNSYTVPEFTRLDFYISRGGTKISNPANGTDVWSTSLIDSIQSGNSETIIISGVYGAEGTHGMDTLCAELFQLIPVKGPQPGLNTNMDPNKEFCEEFSFDFPASISNVKGTEISKIATDGDLMKVYINGTANTQIKMLSITGQVVKTINTTVTGNNFVENVDISDVTPGVYIVTIQSENGTASAKKVFIQ